MSVLFEHKSNLPLIDGIIDMTEELFLFLLCSRLPLLSIKNVSGQCETNFLFPFLCLWNNLNAERPSMWAGGLTPAMSRNVGAKSMFRTISFILEKKKLYKRRTVKTECWKAVRFIRALTLSQVQCRVL